LYKFVESIKLVDVSFDMVLKTRFDISYNEDAFVDSFLYQVAMLCIKRKGLYLNHDTDIGIGVLTDIYITGKVQPDTATYNYYFRDWTFLIDNIIANRMIENYDEFVRNVFKYKHISYDSAWSYAFSLNNDNNNLISINEIEETITVLRQEDLPGLYNE